MSVCDSLQTVLVSASSSEASVSQSGRALVPVSGVSVPVLSVSVDEGVSVPAAPSAPVCTSGSVQVPRLQDSSVLVQASGIASSKSSSSSSSVNVPVRWHFFFKLSGRRYLSHLSYGRLNRLYHFTV